LHSAIIDRTSREGPYPNPQEIRADLMESESVVQSIKPLTKEEAYQREQKQALTSIRVGEICPSGCKVVKIFARGDEYVIYEIESTNPVESIRVYIHTKVEDNEQPVENFNKAKDAFDRIKSIIFKYSADSSYKQRAASALVLAIRGNVEEATKIFTKIEIDARTDFSQRVLGRLYYLLGAFVLCVVACSLSTYAYIYRQDPFLTDNRILLQFSYATAYASIGGFFSVSLKAKDVWAQQAIQNWMYSLYGAERLVISVIAGIITFTAIKAGIVFAFVESSQAGPFIVLSLCFLSGFSESLIPNYMGRLEKEA
jgi:hypothetical protein